MMKKMFKKKKSEMRSRDSVKMSLFANHNHLKHLEVPEDNSPSGASTPVFSWSPLPQRRQLNFTEKEFEYKITQKKCYPNCDVNVWLRSCEEEIIEPIEGVVSGHIPKWLKGCLIRNGPGSLKAGKDTFEHLFDSSALLHRFGIENGKVTYQCRFLQSEIYKKNWQANRIVITEFGTKAVPDPCHSIFQKVAAIFHPKSDTSDNSMISVYPFGDELYAFNEIPIIHKINTENLETEARVDVSDYVSIVNHTSHPHVTHDGTVYNLGMSVTASGPHHNIICFPSKHTCYNKTMFEKAQIVASIPARWPLHPSYMHTFGITKKYFLIVEQPLNLSVTALVATKLKNDPIAGCLRWYQDEYVQINVICRETGRLKNKFFAEPFFYLHIINQYETHDYLVLDICMYRDPAMLDCMYIETMKAMQQNPDYAKMFRGRPARFVLPLKPEPMDRHINSNLVNLEHSKAKAYYLPNGEIFLKPEKLCDLGCETPRIFYEVHLGKPYRYFYAISSDVDAENPGTIIKVDIYNKSAKTWCEPNCYPSEPVFVPSPNPRFEDDGVVLAAMVWGNEDTNHAGLLILDAKTFTEIGRAEFETPGPVPKCLHGWFVPKEPLVI
ncbi:unnamed protein product [Brassicogethes aeneus]|uniref:Uncharacterized protein n=1 Tax=Brassicogethes aeneus TaxID=1431903 RepID=A0A9P0AVB3_BRAAE|nr:unnamed protein product [Brassicogethes aeneus]